MQIEKGSGSAPFYSCPVEANDYVDKKFIHNYREKSANLKKKNFIQQDTLFQNKIEIHFPYNLLLSKPKVHHMYFYIDGYLVFNLFDDRLSVVCPKSYQFIFQP